MDATGANPQRISHWPDQKHLPQKKSAIPCRLSHTNRDCCTNLEQNLPHQQARGQQRKADAEQLGKVAYFSKQATACRAFTIANHCGHYGVTTRNAPRLSVLQSLQGNLIDLPLAFMFFQVILKIFHVGHVNVDAPDLKFRVQDGAKMTKVQTAN